MWGCTNTIGPMVTNKDIQSQKDPEATYQWYFSIWSFFAVIPTEWTCYLLSANPHEHKNHSIQYVTDCMYSLHYTLRLSLLLFRTFFALGFLYRANAHQFMAVNW